MRMESSLQKLLPLLMRIQIANLFVKTDSNELLYITARKII